MLVLINGRDLLACVYDLAGVCPCFYTESFGSLSQVMDLGRAESICSINATSTTARFGECAFWVMICIYITITVFTVFVLSSVIAAKAVHGTIRFVLVNILSASITTCLGIGLINLRTGIFVITHHFSPTDFSYKIFFAVTSIGGNGRSAFMAVFAVVVVMIIKGSNSAVRFRYLVISALVVWIACVAVGLLLVVPGVLKVDPIDCRLTGPQVWIFAVLYFLLFVILPFILAALMPIYAFCYIRSNNVLEDTAGLKQMLKFAIFLLVGNMLCFVGHCIAATGALIAKYNYIDNEVALVLLYIYNVLLALSLVPTPILILVYFKPVRLQIRKLVFRVCNKWCKKRVLMSRQGPLTDMMLATPVEDM